MTGPDSEGCCLICVSMLFSLILHRTHDEITSVRKEKNFHKDARKHNAFVIPPQPLRTLNKQISSKYGNTRHAPQQECPKKKPDVNHTNNPAQDQSNSLFLCCTDRTYLLRPLFDISSQIKRLKERYMCRFTHDPSRFPRIGIV